MHVLLIKFENLKILSVSSGESCKTTMRILRHLIRFTLLIACTCMLDGLGLDLNIASRPFICMFT